MIQLKKTLLTLVALLALTTQSWATAPTVYSEAVAISQLQVGDILTPGFSLTGNGTVSLQGDRCKMDGSLQSGSNPLVENSYITYNSDGTLTIENMSVTPVDGDGNDGNAWEVTATSPEITIAGTTYTPATGTAVTFTRGTGDKANECTMDGGMPAGNVEVTVNYFAMAEFAKKANSDDDDVPTANTGVQAKTDAPLLTEGVVKNFAGTTTPQGRVKYFAVQADSQPDEPKVTDTGWSYDVPNAADYNEGKVYVWYYIEGADAPTGTEPADDNPCSDSNVTPLGIATYVELGPEPTYNVTFADGVNPEAPAAPIWTATPSTGVKKGDKVTVTYTGERKVIGVKAEKLGAAKPAATVSYAPQMNTSMGAFDAGQDKSLVIPGTADGGTMMFDMTTTNTQPTSTDGFTNATPNASIITEAGTYYIWYYVKGDADHSDSEISATAIEVTVRPKHYSHLQTASNTKVSSLDVKSTVIREEALALAKYLYVQNGNSVPIAVMYGSASSLSTAVGYDGTVNNGTNIEIKDKKDINQHADMDHYGGTLYYVENY